ncbi:hypothetical protein Hanom_Chr09g00794321 [Helianthus anomalus]
MLQREKTNLSEMVQRISRSPSLRFPHHQRAPNALLNQPPRRKAHWHQHPALRL